MRASILCALRNIETDVLYRQCQVKFTLVSNYMSHSFYWLSNRFCWPPQLWRPRAQKCWPEASDCTEADNAKDQLASEASGPRRVSAATCSSVTRWSRLKRYKVARTYSAYEVNDTTLAGHYSLITLAALDFSHACVRSLRFPFILNFKVLFSFPK